MKLNELFQRTYPYKWVSKDPLNWIAEFKTNDSRTVHLGIRNIYDELWDVLFTADGSAGETGQGDQIKIFATVLEALQEFDAKIQPKEVQFSAGVDGDDNSRARLYRALLKRFGDAFFVREQDRSKPGDAKVKFSLLRRQANQDATI